MVSICRSLFTLALLAGCCTVPGCFLFEDPDDDDDDTASFDGTWDVYVYNDVSVDGGWQVDIDVWLDHEFVGIASQNDGLLIEEVELGTHTLSACSTAGEQFYWAGDEIEFTIDDSGGSAPYVTFMGVVEWGPIDYMGNGVESWFLTGDPACI